MEDNDKNGNRDGEVRCNNLLKTYNPGKENEFIALKGVNLKISEGEFVSLIGSSGSGKSTLLNMISCLDTPTSGEVHIEGVLISTLSDFEKAKLRREKFGFIFQQFNLIRSMTSFENVELPMRFKGILSKSERKKRVDKLFSLLGLEGKERNKPTELSGGQQQRVAIARALANDPKIILADEPTGNLDSRTGDKIMEILDKLNKEEKKTILIVTHDKKIADMTDRIIHIRDGKII